MQRLFLLMARSLGPRYLITRDNYVDQEPAEGEQAEPSPLSPQCELYSQIKYGRTGWGRNEAESGVCHILAKRQLLNEAPTAGRRIAITDSMLPEHPCLADVLPSRVFCGTYTRHGNMFIAACQDHNIYLYDTSGGRFRLLHTVGARDVSWSILDTALSPDENWFIYTSWSPFVHLCNVDGDSSKHYSLDLCPDDDNFCAFSATFSGDNKEILASANDGCLYVYSRERAMRVEKINAHEDDANAVVYADNSGQVIFSGGDDGMVKVWDRRCDIRSPVGCLAGHKDGVTFIDPRGDGYHLISNSKDQSIKLWDIRHPSPQEGVEATRKKVAHQQWDYRQQAVPRPVRSEAAKKLPGDTSLMTYTGHIVRQTLLRCRFSPAFTTGQRYIYTACAKGRVIIYDLLTGKIIKTLTSPSCHNCVRDVFWHPTEPEITASTWDCTLQMWTFRQREDYVDSDDYEYNVRGGLGYNI